MRIVTAQQMQAIDHYAIERLEIPAIILMENAALRTLDAMDLVRRSTFAIFCGTGNNGADGLAIARGLIALGKQVCCFIVGEKGRGSEAFKLQYRILEHLNVELRWLETLGDLSDMIERLKSVNTIVDCIFGTGLDRELRGMAPIVIEQINQSRVYTYAVDMPSGINATTGESHGAYVQADEIICLQYLKRGLADNPLIFGKVHVVPIGIPDVVYDKVVGRGA